MITWALAQLKFLATYWKQWSLYSVQFWGQGTGPKLEPVTSEMLLMSFEDKQEERVTYLYDFKALRSTSYSISFRMTHTKPKHSPFALFRAIMVNISRDVVSILQMKMMQMSKMMFIFKRTRQKKSLLFLLGSVNLQTRLPVEILNERKTCSYTLIDF